MKTTRILIAALAAFALVAAGCGDDDDSGGGGGADLSAEEQAYADALAASLVDDSGEELPITQSEADCVAEQSVAVVGIDKLEELGSPDEVVEATDDDLSALDLSDDQIGEIVDVYLDCADLVNKFEEELTADDELTDEQKSCLSDLIDEDFLREILVAELSGEDPSEEMFALFTECA